MTHDNDERLAAWLADGPAHGPAVRLQSALSRTRSGGQRPGWLVPPPAGRSRRALPAASSGSDSWPSFCWSLPSLPAP